MKSVEEQYWHNGLHDAYIKKAKRGYDDQRDQKYFTLFIAADSAMYDQEVKSITFYNYKIKKGNYNASDSYWLSDVLKKQADNYIIEIDLESASDNSEKHLIIEFEQITVER